MDEEIEKKLPDTPTEENVEDGKPMDEEPKQEPVDAPEEKPEAEDEAKAPEDGVSEEPSAPIQEPEPAPAEPEPEAQPPLGDNPAPEAEPMRTFTQEQVNKLVGKAREEGRAAGYKMGYDKAHEETLGRYGVDDDEQLDGLFADGTRFSEQLARYDDVNGQLREANSQLALLRSGVIPERHADVKAILAANGMDVTEEAIKSFIPTHPEWIAQQPQAQMGAPAPEIPQPTPSAPAQDGGQPKPNESGVMGAEPSQAPSGDESEEDMAMKLFGLNK